MDALALGRRIAQARDDAGLTQQALGRRVGLDRTAITRLERGERKVSVTEMIDIAGALRRPLSFFIAEPTAAAVSRRAEGRETHALDAELGTFELDVRTLLELGVLQSPGLAGEAHLPAGREQAEVEALVVRRSIGLDSGPIEDLGRVCERLGLFAYVVGLGPSGADGGCLEVRLSERAVAAVAVINSERPAGRRRMTLAHELGHWLFGDAYDIEASSDAERMINSFAIHFLAPRHGVVGLWRELDGGDPRDRCLTVAAMFRLSWSAAILHLRNVGLVAQDEWRQLEASKPRAGDYGRLGLQPPQDLGAGYLSPAFVAAVLTAYLAGELTQERCLECLRGTMSADDLPVQSWTEADLARVFEGHGE